MYSIAHVCKCVYKGQYSISLFDNPVTNRVTGGKKVSSDEIVTNMFLSNKQF